MTYDAKTPEDYINQVPEDRQDALKKLRKTINDNLPKGFKECINYNMIGYVVPHKIYPGGYHCDTTLPLPFMSFASQKNSVNFYHMGIYAKPELYDWFINQYPKHSKRKLDIGKSCIRFKKIDEIPYDLIAELVQKMTVEEWITVYETALKKK
ncbi:MAG TPA: DUF1801 domain-containing protein [Flavobacteriaceae bacterium]|nr:DUF1801 domain-containing protein [Flavobacteriaceae bacterium]